MSYRNPQNYSNHRQTAQPNRTNNWQREQNGFSSFWSSHQNQRNNPQLHDTIQQNQSNNNIQNEKNLPLQLINKNTSQPVIINSRHVIKFKCIICFELEKNTKMCPQCQHPICLKCLDNIKVCPTCRGEKKVFLDNKIGNYYNNQIIFNCKTHQHRVIEYCINCYKYICQQCQPDHQAHNRQDLNDEHIKNWKTIFKDYNLKKQDLVSMKEQQEKIINSKAQKILGFIAKLDNQQKEWFSNQKKIMKQETDKIITNTISPYQKQVNIYKELVEILEKANRSSNPWEKLIGYCKYQEKVKEVEFEKNDNNNNIPTNFSNNFNLFPGYYLQKVDFDIKDRKIRVSQNIKIFNKNWTVQISNREVRGREIEENWRCKLGLIYEDNYVKDCIIDIIVRYFRNSGEKFLCKTELDLGNMNKVTIDWCIDTDEMMKIKTNSGKFQIDWFIKYKYYNFIIDNYS